jgi:hypothetical protein
METTASSLRRFAPAAALVVLLTVVCLAVGLVTRASAAEFNPRWIISDSNMRDYDSMSARQIQTFLDRQPGRLDTLVTADHLGVKKRASTIIWEACQAWTISPKVMLTMLQKEQSLLTRTSLGTNTLSRAIGAGCPNATTNKYPGFGQQMWYGARLLDGYGEGKNGSTIALFHPGIYVYDIYQTPNIKVYTANVATYKLYIYNPSIGAKAPYGDLSGQAASLSGNANFWKIHWKYFGDPLANPPAYHTKVRIVKKVQLWNSTIGTKRKPSPGKGGIVNVTGPIITRKGHKYIPVSWGGNRTGGWVRYDYVRWVQ